MPEKKLKLSFVLASASPRRKTLLAQAGYDFKVVVSGINESAFDCAGIEPGQYAKKLALAKAKDVARRYPDEIVIGADTIAELGGEIIGKAKTEEHAKEITGKLFSSSHRVITAIAIVCAAKKVEMVEVDTTVVYPKKLTASQIASHIKSGKWRGKAGAYAIAETGDEFVERTEGSITNVMGLGMELFTEMLRTLSE